MGVFKKKAKEEAEEKPVEKPTSPPRFEKTDAHCVVDDCQELKQVGQGAFCHKHVRT